MIARAASGRKVGPYGALGRVATGAVILMLAGCEATVSPTAVSHTSAVSIASPSPAAREALTAPVLARIPVPDPRVDTNPPDPVVAAGGAIWIVQDRSSCCRLVRVAPATGAVTTVPESIDLGTWVGDDSSLWVLATCCGGRSIESEALTRVDSSTGALASPSIALPSFSGVALAVGLGSIWYSTEVDALRRVPNLLVRLDATTGHQMKRWPVGLGDLQVACGAVWGTVIQADGVTRVLARFDPSTGKTTSVGGEAPVFETADGCWHWVAGGFERIAPSPSLTTSTPERGNLQLAGSSLWDWPGRYLQRWDPVTGEDSGPKWVVAAEDLGAFAYQVGVDPGELRLVAADGSLWMVTRTELVRLNIAAGR